MKLLQHIRSIFAPATVSSIISTELPLERQLVVQCATMIEQLEFQRYMALAKIAALETWALQEQERADKQANYLKGNNNGNNLS